jgi:hypothetical protein
MSRGIDSSIFTHTITLAEVHAHSRHILRPDIVRLYTFHRHASVRAPFPAEGKVAHPDIPKVMLVQQVRSDDVARHTTCFAAYWLRL